MIHEVDRFEEPQGPPHVQTTEQGRGEGGSASLRHPRTIGWFGTTAVAMGGYNQSLFLLGALIAGQQTVSGQGSTAILLLIVGLLLSFAAAPGWVELVLMQPDRVGGVAAACSDAFRPYSPLLAALTGTCYWWGWAPTAGLTAILEASAIKQWWAPSLSVPIAASLIVALSVVLNLAGIRWVARVAIPMALLSAALAFVSTLGPVMTGQVNWVQASTFHLDTPFAGTFGAITSVMAGIFIIGTVAPGFEVAVGFVGETIDPVRNVPRAMLASALMAAVYFIILPIIWLGMFGPKPLAGDLAVGLGPAFAPVFGSAAKAVAVGFMALNMFPGTIQPIANAARALSQLTEDGLLPRALALRNRHDAPWVAIVATAAISILMLWVADPVHMAAAASFTYLIGICMPSVAVWLLRRDAPDQPRPFRASRGMIGLGLCATVVWLLSAILGFEQFGISAVLIGLALAYSGIALFGWRKFSDRRRAGLPGIKRSLHLTLTGSMTIVLALNAAGYQMAIGRLPVGDGHVSSGLEDIFVAVAMLTITVGLVLPGIIAHSVVEVSEATKRLVSGTLLDFTRAMEALGEGNLAAAKVDFEFSPVKVRTHDEVGEMAGCFNELQREMQRSAVGLAGAREGLSLARKQLLDSNRELVARVHERGRLVEELTEARDAAEAASLAKGRFVAKMSHEIRTPMNGVLSTIDLLSHSKVTPAQQKLISIIERSGATLLALVNEVLDYSKVFARQHVTENREFDLVEFARNTFDDMSAQAEKCGIGYRLTLPAGRTALVVIGDPLQLSVVLHNIIANALKFTQRGTVDVELRLLGETFETIDAEFRITDTGIGMSDEFKSRIFLPFEQANESTTRAVEGAGLGLSIVKEIVDSMGGEITIESEIDRGTVFCVKVNLAKAHPEMQPLYCTVAQNREQKIAECPEGHKGILVAEDNAINQEVIAASLTRLGHAFRIVDNGAAALAALEEETYCLVLMDCRMPIMDGFEATRAIRSRELAQQNGAHIPILAISANAMESDRELCFASGMDDHIAKPFTLAQLKQKFEKWMPGSERRADERPAREAAAATDTPEHRLLDVEALRAIGDLQMPGQPSIVKELIDSFFSTAPQQLHVIDARLSEGDLKGSALAAHGMKSASAAIGLSELSDAFKHIESCAGNGQREQASAMAQETKSLLNRSLRELSLFRDNCD